METIKISENIPLRCFTVDTFPNGISQAFDRLMNDFPMDKDRRYYGISWMDENHKVIYKVASNVLNEKDSAKEGYDSHVLLSGNYIAETLLKWMEQLPKIGETFGRMMEVPGFDKTSPCVEWYIDDEKMICLARLKEEVPIPSLT